MSDENNGHIEKIDLTIAPEPQAGAPPAQPSPQELLDAVHQFPCEFLIKVIGASSDNFIQRVIAAVIALDILETDVTYTSRHTSGGRHTSVSLTLIAQSSQQVMDIFAAIRQVHGVVMVM